MAAPPAPNRALDAGIAADLTGMMTRTCAEGSAATAFAGRRGIPNVAVAGKTGTLSRDDDGPYMQYSWFVGFFAAVGDILFMNTYYFWTEDAWDNKGTGFDHKAVMGAAKSVSGSGL